MPRIERILSGGGRRIFLDQKGRRSMAAEQGQEPLRQALRPDPVLDRPGNVLEPLPLRLYLKSTDYLTHKARLTASYQPRHSGRIGCRSACTDLR